MNPPREPRAGSESLGGIPWLARMIDKARLEATGQIDAFDLDYPCPMDMSLLSQLGLSGKDFQAIVMSAQSDDEILAELKKRNALNVG